jgi:hypothetical protein
VKNLTKPATARLAVLRALALLKRFLKKQTP